MKKLIAFILVIIALYTAYWFVMSGAVKKAAQEKISEYETSGYVITHAPLEMKGYPLHFDAALGPMQVTAPSTALGGAGAKIVLDAVDISGKAYNPLSWSLVHSGVGTMDLPMGQGQRWVFDTQTQRADIDMRASASGTLKRLDVDALDVRFTSKNQGSIPVRRVGSGTYKFKTGGSQATYSLLAKDLLLNASDLGPIGRAFGDEARSISGTMTATGYGGASPNYVSEDLSLLWGPADMGGGFNLTAGDNGYSGSLVLNVANESALLDALTREGVLSSGEAFMANLAIGGMPQTEDGRRTLTLTVRDNNVGLGPLKIGRLPF